MPSFAFMPSNSNARRKPLARAIGAIVLTGALIPSFSGFAAVDTGTPSPASASSAVSTTDRVRYTIVLKGDALASYRGGVAGLSAASRIATGRRAGRLDVNAPVSRAYVEYLANRQSAFVDELAASIGRPITTIAKMQHALNAVIVELDDAEADVARQRVDVDFVERERILELLTDRGPTFIGAPTIWDGTNSNGVATQGEGVVIADLDTGINWQSPAFAATGPVDGYVHANP
ncbi:MAG: S8 family serine peptidase, partial [Rhodanobacteraceae bacterium]